MNEKTRFWIYIKVQQKVFENYFPMKVYWKLSQRYEISELILPLKFFAFHFRWKSDEIDLQLRGNRVTRSVKVFDIFPIAFISRIPWDTMDAEKYICGLTSISTNLVSRVNTV